MGKCEEIEGEMFNKCKDFQKIKDLQAKWPFGRS
jgi:hypothetical protein